jgi:hypothetical protein
MTRVEVSPKPTVILRIVTRMVGLLVSGRVMLNDPNIYYQMISTLYFVSVLTTTVGWIVYAQWRAKNGWISEIDIPDDWGK